MSVYLGLDCSTQSLTAMAIEVDGPRRALLFERSIEFDDAFPGYGTRRGVLPSDDPLIVHSAPLLWSDALDRIMCLIAREGGVWLPQVRAIAACAQQHGSVYLGPGAEANLGRLGPGDFTRAHAPIWMDASTTAQCDRITRAVGGPEALARLTGSRAFERFAGPQIKKFAEENPAAYARTARIHLVSSFVTSLLAGRHAPLDPGDASGMNLMDIAARRWAPLALDATAGAGGRLEDKLPEIVPPWTVVGPLASYWRERYGFPAARVVVGSGDNPSSLVGTGLVRRGAVAISLGTSDTLFAPLAGPRFDPSGAGHVFGSPTGEYMSLICCRNGSLARERVRDEYGLDWDGFDRALAAAPPGNRGAVMLPWFEPEITPHVEVPGVRRFGIDPRDGPANVRGVVEAQMLALAVHSRWMGLTIETIHATGGAAVNRGILQVMADVHNADVYQLRDGNSACLGAALRAYHADALAAGQPQSWEQIVAGFAEPIAASRVRPIAAHVAMYRDLVQLYEARETEARLQPR